MKEAFIIFAAGIAGVFLGMLLLYGAIRLAAVLIHTLTRKKETP
jgi:hypothetical protein